MRLYLETTIWAAFTYFKRIEKDRYDAVSKLLQICKEKGIEVVVSFYTLHEIFLLAFDYVKVSVARKIGKRFMLEILNRDIELIELLSREKRLIHQPRFRMRDRTDIPHAISAFVEKCDYIITYDIHFDSISHLVKVSTPEEFINNLDKITLKKKINHEP